MKHSKNYQTSFNGYPLHCPERLTRPENYFGPETITSACIARGMGGSYGDAALNKGGHLILTERIDRFLEFNEKKGFICVEAGISLIKILNAIVPRGWFLPVTPGTANVSLGGCVAADVHGKNHHYVGTIGQHVLALELIIASGERIVCSPDIFPELFWATIGGMGLTGIIGTITLKLKPITTAYMLVQYQESGNLETTFNYLTQDNSLDEYQVAWLDGLNLPLGRSIIMRARHADLASLAPQQQYKPFVISKSKSYKLPFYLPNGVLNQAFIKIFNKLYYRQLAKKNYPFLLPFYNFFYPLDLITNWPRLYGKRGFLQYQCVLPTVSSRKVIKQILETLAYEQYPIYLAVLKRFGNQSSAAPLSFPLPGFTLALDLPIVNKKLFSCLDRLDALILAEGGRVYLAKDARLKSEAFRVMYPCYSKWLAVKQQWDPGNKFSSSLARRLELVG